MSNQNKEVEKFNLGGLGLKFPIIVVYKHPEDYPDKYLARLWDIKTPTKLIATADSLDELRKGKPTEMMIMQRHPEDDPKIVETWI